MKRITDILKIIVFVLTVGMFSNCNQINLSNQEAQALIVKHLNLPQKFRQDVRVYEQHVYLENNIQSILTKNGFLNRIDYYDRWYSIYLVTDKAKQYCIQNDNKIAAFKTFDIDFNEITGIAINKEQQIATVRFSLKATNVTPVGKALEENIDNPQNSELIFKNFDNGWQLESNQNKSGTQLVQEIIWPKKN